MGLLPETLFGWTKPQPALDAKWMQQASMQEADVLVIGDSFSDSRVWQTVLTQHGLKVRTEILGQHARDMCRLHALAARTRFRRKICGTRIH